MTWRATQELILVVSGVPSAQQYLHLDCEDRRPSAVADVQAWAASADDTSNEEACTTGVAAVETNPSTTIATAAVGPAQSDPTAMVVSSGTGVVVGRQYLITEDNTGANEFFEVVSVNGTTIKAKHPLKNDYSVGSTVQTTRWSIAVDTTWIADVSNLSPTFSPNPTYRLRWSATVNGNSTVYQTGFDVVRYPVNHGVTGLHVEAAHRGWLDRLPPDHQIDQGRALIEAAYQSVKFELYGDGKADQAVRNPELLARLVVMRCPLEALYDNLNRGANVTAAVDVAEKRWRQIYDQTFRAPIAAIDETGGGGASTNEPLPLWVRL